MVDRVAVLKSTCARCAWQIVGPQEQKHAVEMASAHLGGCEGPTLVLDADGLMLRARFSHPDGTLPLVLYKKVIAERRAMLISKVE